MSAEDPVVARLERLEGKLAGLEALEARLASLFGSWENLQDLGRDLGLLMDPTVRLFTEELAEVETGFQLEDALALIKRLLLSFRNLAWSLDRSHSSRSPRSPMTVSASTRHGNGRSRMSRRSSALYANASPL